MADQSIIDQIAQKIFGDPAPEKFLDEVQKGADQKKKLLPSREKRIGRLEDIAASEGLSPPAEKNPFSVYNILDTFATPGQYVRGGLAKLVGEPGYTDEGFADAATKGTAEDIYTAKLLRRLPVIGTGERAGGLPEYLKGTIRGGLGFAGDIASDPLSYFTIFSRGLGAQKGGLPLSEDLIRAGGSTKTPMDLYRDLLGKHSATAATEIADIEKGISSGLRSEEAGRLLQSYIAQRPERLASKPFRDLNETLANFRGQKAQGLDSIASQRSSFAEPLVEARKSRLAQIAEEMGNVHADDLDKIFKQRAIRFNSPFAGFPSFGKIPILGAAELDIPLVTDISKKIYRGLGDGVYNAKVTFATKVNEGLKNNPDSLFFQAAARIGKTLQGTNDFLTGAASKVSRRTLASGQVIGPRAQQEAILEHEVAAGTNDLLATAEAEYILGKLPKDRPDIRAGITDALQSGIQHMKKKDGSVASTAAQIEEDLAAYQKGLQNITQKYGPEAAEATERIRELFEKLDIKEAGAGVKHGTIRAYVHQMFDSGLTDDMVDSPAKKAAMNLFGHGDAADFKLGRTMRTISEAEALGLKPEKDIYKILQKRLYVHHRAMGEKDFAERMAYNFSLPQDAYRQLQALSLDESRGMQQQASAALSKYGFENPLELLTTANGGAVVTKRGLVDGEVYDRWLDHSYHPPGAGDFNELERVAMQEIEAGAPVLANKLKAGATKQQLLLDPEILAERAELQQKADVFKGSVRTLVGRDGEGPLARAGATTVSMQTKKRFDHLFQGDEETKAFFDNILPRSFAEAVDESVKGMSAMRSLESQLAAAGVKDPALDPLRKALGFYTGAVKLQKVGATLFWPAYWIRNLTGAPLQSAHAVAQLGENFSIPQMHKVWKIISGKGDALIGGRAVSGKQLQMEMAQFGITGSVLNQVDLMHTYNDQLASLINTSESLRSIPAFRKYLEKPPGLIKKTLGKIEVGFTGKSGYTDWAWEKIPAFGDRLEAFGRQHLYITRRMRGDDPQSAANIVRRMMVDYGHGKTAFERNFLNNMFFFYSFSRGNLPTLFTSMMERPGMLSMGLSAKQSIAEMIGSSSEIENDTDLGERLKSIRQREGASIVVGKNKTTGLPVVVSSFGHPDEDLSRFSALYLPTGSTWRDLISAAGNTASRSLQLAVSQMNPWITSAYKIATKQDPFYDKPITDKKLRTIAGFERDVTDLSRYTLDKIPNDAMKKIDRELFGMLGGTNNGDGTWTVDPYVYLLLTNVVPGASRLINTRNALSKPGQAGTTKFLRGLTGVNVQDQDLETSAVFDRERQLTEFLQERDIPTSVKAYREFKRNQEPEDEE